MDVKVTDVHKGLHEFVGNWKLEQKQWSAPNAKPVIHHGTTEYTVILNGLAAVMNVDVPSSGFKGLGLLTYNIKDGHLDMAWIDTLSDQGIVMMSGLPEKAPAAHSIRSAFSQEATQERTWTTVVNAASACVPSKVLAAAAPHVNVARTAGAPAPQTVPMRLVENKISDNHWVLDFYLPGPEGEYLAQQNSFTRAS
jgi:Protein of unknown function (DUF1579)